MIQHKKLIVANWKMNLNVSQASILVHRLQERIVNRSDVEVVLAPSMLALQPMSKQIDRRKFRLAAQNVSERSEGALTGEVAVSMIEGLVHYVIIGHSERRAYFNETPEQTGKKVNAVLQHGMMPMLCIGETAEEKNAGMTNRVLHDQLTAGMSFVDGSQLAEIVIAYEPRWAIGAGVTPSSDDIDDATSFIFKFLQDTYGPRRAERVRILYGGSVKAHNTRDILAVKNVHGVLVGGASLIYAEFAKIVENAHNEA